MYCSLWLGDNTTEKYNHIRFPKQCNEKIMKNKIWIIIILFEKVYKNKVTSKSLFVHSKLLYFLIKVGSIAVDLFEIWVNTLCVCVHLYILLWCLCQDLIQFHFSSLTYHTWKIRDYILPYFKEVMRIK